MVDPKTSKHILVLLLAIKPAIKVTHFLGSSPEGVDDFCFHTYGEPRLSSKYVF